MKKNLKNRTAFSFILLLSAFSLLFISSCNDESEEVGNSAKMSMKTLPKVHYVLGEALDLSGMIVRVGEGSSSKEVPYASFGSEGIVCEPDNGTILTFDHESVIIRNSNTGTGITQSIDVTNNIASMVVKTLPGTDYFTGEMLDLTGMVIEATLEDGTKEDIPFENFGESFMVDPAHGDVLASDVNNVSITHMATEVGTEMAISVVDFVPTSATVVSLPVKTSYEIGVRLNLEGLVVKYETTVGITKEIPAVNFELYGITTDPAKDDRVGAGNSTITVLHDASGVNTSFDIEVIPLDVSSLTIKTNPNKVAYSDGNEIDLTGLEVTLAINGGDDVNVAFADFNTYGVSVDPAQGDIYDSSISEIVVTHDASGESASISLGGIYESDFSSGTDGFWYGNENGNISAVDGKLVATIDAPSPTSWKNSFTRNVDGLVDGGTYKIIVEAKSIGGTRSVRNQVGLNGGSYVDFLGWSHYLNLTEEYQTFEKSFTVDMQGTTHPIRITFDTDQGDNINTDFVINKIFIVKL